MRPCCYQSLHGGRFFRADDLGLSWPSTQDRQDPVQEEDIHPLHYIMPYKPPWIKPETGQKERAGTRVDLRPLALVFTVDSWRYRIRYQLYGAGAAPPLDT